MKVRLRYRLMFRLLNHFRDPYMEESRRRMQELARASRPR